MPTDFFCKPWLNKFRPISAVPSLVGKNDHQDFQFRIDPNECVYCQKDKEVGTKLDPDPAFHYHVVIHLAVTKIVQHDCLQRAYEKMPISFVYAFILSKEHPEGERRLYAPVPNGKCSVTLRSFSELGHLLDHASGIFCYDEKWTFGLLSHTRFVASSLDEIGVTFDWKQPWPSDKDPLVPTPYRTWWKSFLESADSVAPYVHKPESSISKTKPEELLPEGVSKNDQKHECANNKNIKEQLETLSKRTATVPAEFTTTTTTTSPSNGINTIASLNPFQSWPKPPVFDANSPDWEGKPTEPEKDLWDWEYDPINTPKLYASVCQASTSALTGLGRGSSPFMSREAVRASRKKERFLPPPANLSKPAPPYFSEARMRDWRAKCNSIGAVTHDTIHRPVLLNMLVKLNQFQTIWREEKSHIARIYPSERKTELDRITTPQQQATTYKQEKYNDLIESMNHELSCIVDLCWCVFVDGLRLVCPDPSASSGGFLVPAAMKTKTASSHSLIKHYHKFL